MVHLIKVYILSLDKEPIDDPLGRQLVVNGLSKYQMIWSYLYIVFKMKYQPPTHLQRLNPATTLSTKLIISRHFYNKADIRANLKQNFI